MSPKTKTKRPAAPAAKTPRQPAPRAAGRTFRLAAEPRLLPLVEALLTAQGFVFEPEPFSPLCRRTVEEPFPLGASLAARFGFIYILDRSSCLPPICLNPPPGAVILDMCASPGSKTSHLSSLTGPGGAVLACEPNPSRHETLRANLTRLNCANTVTHKGQAQRLALPAGLFDHILLDPPCSGWGTLDKNPKAAAIWREDKTAPLVHLQKELLAEACRLLKPGGSLVFSTCTTNVAENEDQVRHALDHLPLALSPLAPPAGFAFHDPARPELEGVLRVDESQSQAQGFFIARFTRLDRDAWPMPEYPKGPPDGSLPLPLDEPWMQASRLGPGCLSPVGGRTWCFEPLPLLDLLPRHFARRGIPLYTGNGDDLRPLPGARCLLPEYSPETGVQLDLDDIGRLLAGQSLDNPLPDCPHPGIHHQGLPLGFATAKGKRLLWSGN